MVNETGTKREKDDCAYEKQSKKNRSHIPSTHLRKKFNQIFCLFLQNYRQNSFYQVSYPPLLRLLWYFVSQFFEHVRKNELLVGRARHIARVRYNDIQSN
mmetsp:Transcript_10059/g.14220  ORF Transcript_10059/g.14220 Transcript_10059/m.14220 type:complete len:100 (-) Transcript_10059:350-649(-)